MTSRRAKSPKPTATQQPRDPEAHMPIMAHIAELRTRLMRALIALGIGSVLGATFATPVLEFLQAPYGAEFITLGPTDSVIAYFRVSLLLGGILAIPVITYQVLMFVMPGLTTRERRIVLTALPVVTLLFLVGVIFAWGVLIPPAIGFLGGFQPTLFRPQWTADLYLGFVTSLLFWMGVAFQTPLIFFVIAFLGFVTPRRLVRNWRIAVIGSSIAAAIITPTIDPVNMIIVMGPLMVLYLLSIGLVAVGARISPARPDRSGD